MTKFTDEEDEVLIHLVKQNPSIYAIKSKSYKYLDAKNHAWNIVSQAMKKSELHCRTRWKSIRDYYHRKKRAVIEGTATASDGNYFFKKFNHLSFLDSDLFIKQEFPSGLEEQAEDSSHSHPVIENYTTTADQEIKTEEIPSLNDAEDSNENDQESIKVTQTISVEVDEFQDDSSNSESERSELRKDQRDNKDKNEAIKRQVPPESLCSESKKIRLEHAAPSENLSFATGNSALDYFFKSIYATVSKFSPAYQAKAKIGIMQAVGSIEVEITQSDQCRLTSTPSTSSAQILCLRPLMK